MGRRKKEAPSAHREHIAAAAAQLFQARGIDGASMDEIAQAAGYSKATLYVYFANKQEIVSLLALQSMQMMYECIAQALAQPDNIRACYRRLCQERRNAEGVHPQYLLSPLYGYEQRGDRL